MNKTLEVGLTEVQTIRITCQRENCGGVVEIPVSRLQALVAAVLCPSCSHAFKIKKLGEVQGLAAMGIVLTTLSDLDDCKMEFVLPCPDWVVG